MTNPKSLPDAVERVDTAELRKLLERAPRTPWELNDPREGHLQIRGQMDGDCDGDGRAVTTWPHIADVIDEEDYEAAADLIVAAINALPALLSQLDKLETENERLTVERDEFRIQVRSLDAGLLRVAAEAQDGFAALEEMDEAWAATGYAGNRGHLTLAEQISSLVREIDSTAEASNASLVGALRALQDWQPIETAPRDGTHIILAFGQDHSSEGWYLDDDDEPRPWAFIDIGDNNMVIINRSRDGEYGPSHWRAMPYREPRNRAEPGLSTLESGEATAEAKAASLLGEVERLKAKIEINDHNHAVMRDIYDKERDQLSARLEAVLARDAEWSPSGSKTGCNCINLSHKAEQEYETGKCPHQLARQALQTPDTDKTGDAS